MLTDTALRNLEPKTYKASELPEPFAQRNHHRRLARLAHEERRSPRSVYNKAEYAEQRRYMLEERADMVDAWIDGQTYVPKLMPDNVVVPVLSAMA
jgi:hypothetical protein